ncbi:MAG: SCO family protein [Opitutaceae bacterium]|nr:SCO family protein [Opitutaceae bacterium]
MPRPRWRGFAAAGRFLTGSGLPTFVAAATAVYELFLLAILLAPTNGGLWGSFAQEFKVWCFQYDPRTGGMEWMAVVIMLAEPLFISALLVAIWSMGRRRATAPSVRPARSYRALVAGLIFGALASGGLYALGRPAGEPPVPPFPGERIRTQLPPPEFALVDQWGKPVARADLTGGVTLVTGVYATCATSCPEILQQVQALLKTLPSGARDLLRVWAFSLSPEYDTVDLMRRVTEGYGFVYPQFRYLNGDPAAMRGVLENWQFSARRDYKTGLVEHANLFILVDAQGRIAYRFKLDRRHEGWLREAILALTAEAEATGA